MELGVHLEWVCVPFGYLGSTTDVRNKKNRVTGKAERWHEITLHESFIRRWSLKGKSRPSGQRDCNRESCHVQPSRDLMERTFKSSKHRGC